MRRACGFGRFGYVSMQKLVLRTSILQDTSKLILRPCPLRSFAESREKILEVVSPQKTRIGWIGTGVMGQAMCGHIIAAGYQTTVFSRTRSKVEPLVERGARYAASAKDVAKQSDVVFTMVGYPSDVSEVILGEEGVLGGLREGGVVVDMTTSDPSLALHIYQTAKTQHKHAIDAPVSGGDVGAREARLSIMVGGEAPTIDAIKPLFQVLGKNIVHMGPPSSGQHTKMVNQILIASNMIGVVEGLLYGHKAGLDLHTVIAAVGGGAAGSWSINNLGPRIVKRNFDPGFFVEHFIKDMGIALAEAKRMNLSLPGLALAHQLYIALQAQGHGKKGTHALQLALEKLNNIEHK
jgi:3-hydroxyisobutyrate dehydrogenase